MGTEEYLAPAASSRLWKVFLHFDTVEDSQGAQNTTVHLLEIRRIEETASYTILVEALILNQTPATTAVFERVGLLKAEPLQKGRSLAAVLDYAEEREFMIV